MWHKRIYIIFLVGNYINLLLWLTEVYSPGYILKILNITAVVLMSLMYKKINWKNLS